MTVYRIPENLKAIIFDIDSTLYTHDEYAFEQVDVQIRRYAELRGMTADQARRLFSEFRSGWSREHGGKKISIGNTLLHFGIPMDEIIRWRENLVDPADYLCRDGRLYDALSVLHERYSMLCLTNNPVKIGMKTLEVLGVDGLLLGVVGLDTCGVSKPDMRSLEAAMSMAGVSAGQCLSVGDRYDIDLALPLETGMGAVLVDGVADVYELPQVLCR